MWKSDQWLICLLLRASIDLSLKQLQLLEPECTADQQISEKVDAKQTNNAWRSIAMKYVIE